MNDFINRQEAINALKEDAEWLSSQGSDWQNERMERDVNILQELPSAQPDTSKIENILHGKSAEEQYDFLWWLMQNYGMQFTDTRIAVIEWLRGERNG